MNTPHLTTDIVELLRALYDDAKTERFLTTTGSEGINIEFSPGHAFNITITRARQVKPKGRRVAEKAEQPDPRLEAARETRYAARRARMEMTNVWR